MYESFSYSFIIYLLFFLTSVASVVTKKIFKQSSQVQGEKKCEIFQTKYESYLYGKKLIWKIWIWNFFDALTPIKMIFSTPVVKDKDTFVARSNINNWVFIDIVVQFGLLWHRGIINFGKVGNSAVRLSECFYEINNR